MKIQIMMKINIFLMMIIQHALEAILIKLRMDIITRMILKTQQSKLFVVNVSSCKIGVNLKALLAFFLFIIVQIYLIMKKFLYF
jgi:hypothetical protein